MKTEPQDRGLTPTEFIAGVAVGVVVVGVVLLILTPKSVGAAAGGALVALGGKLLAVSVLGQPGMMGP